MVGDLVKVCDQTDVKRTQAQLQDITAADTGGTQSLINEHYNAMLSCTLGRTAHGQTAMPTTIAASWNSKLLFVLAGAGQLPLPSCPVERCACSRVP